MTARRVVHYVDFALPLQKGYSVRTHEICRALAARGVEPVVVLRRESVSREDDVYKTRGERVLDGIPVLAPSPARDPLRRLAGAGARLGVRGSSWAGRRLDAAAFAREIEARAGRPDVVHVHSPPSLVPEARALANEFDVPLIYEVRGFWELSGIHGDGLVDDVDGIVAIDVAAAREADAVTTLGDTMKRMLVRGGVPDRDVHILANGVDSGRFAPLPRDERLAADLGVAGRPVAGTVTSVRALEGLDAIVDAWPAVLEARPDAVFLVIGEGDELPRLEALARERGVERSVRLAGAVPHDAVRAHLSLFDVFVLPRRAVPVCEIVTPLKPLEAMAAGIPVVASDLPAIREIVRDGETGVLVGAGDRAGLAGALTRLFDDEALRTRLGKAARESVARERSWEAVAQRAAALYDALADRA